jgi:protoporphyrinogen oxidase
MPVKDLINSFAKNVPPEVKKIAEGLKYRDFITVGLLLNKLKVKNETKQITQNNLIPDCWIYIQESNVKIGRLQIFNNWSPYLVKNKDKVWIGLEYFCNQGDDLWNMNDNDFIQFSINELHSINIIDKKEVIESTIIRMPKTYPAYYGTYPQFNLIRNFTDTYENLFLVGRNGMHKYNNQDHSMLTSIIAVNNIINGVTKKENIWNVNTETEYHEEK